MSKILQLPWRTSFFGSLSEYNSFVQGFDELDFCFIFFVYFLKQGSFATY